MSILRTRFLYVLVAVLIVDRLMLFRSQQARDHASWLRSQGDTSGKMGGDEQKPAACKGIEDIYPGKLVGDRWEPDRCELGKRRPEEVLTCMASNGVYFVTDSLGRNILDSYTSLFDTLWNESGGVPDHERPEIATMSWNPATSYKYGFKADYGRKITRRFLQNTATLTVMSNGVWDIGVTSCGPAHYFDYLTLKVKRYKAEMRSFGEMLLLNIPFIHHKESKKDWGILCNPGPRVAAYREALKLVSACTGVGILDTYQMQKQYPNETYDGIHITDRGNSAIVGIILDMLCGMEGDRLRPYHPELSCTEEAVSKAKARWTKVQGASGPPPGCPVGRYSCFESAEDFFNSGT